MNKELTPFANKVCPKNCIADCKECELVEKKLKAIEVIKKYKYFVLTICAIERYIIEEKMSWEDYCKIFPIEERDIESKEDYELLTEVFGNE